MFDIVDTIELSKLRCHFPIFGELKYATYDNFVGRPLAGYSTDPFARNVCLLTRNAAEALCLAQNYLLKKYNDKYGLVIFDAYRPKRAVIDMVHWSKLLPDNNYELERKAIHYPHIEKNKLSELHYVTEDFGPCYGNTVDVMLIDLLTGELLSMGAGFDFMDELSHMTATPTQIGQEAYENRQLLLEIMSMFKFVPFKEEFWHFSHGGVFGREVLKAMDIEITPHLKGVGVTFNKLVGFA